MDNPLGSLKVLKTWKPGDTRELSEKVLKAIRLEGRYDSYSQTYDLDGLRWKVQGQVSQPSGETIYTLVCVNE
ncbi:MAG TPA: hypothetical protein VG204_07380 [Terriglobia bacterium]|nr:hypothetical protein [Terriglobia bacterium]